MKPPALLQTKRSAAIQLAKAIAPPFLWQLAYKVRGGERRAGDPNPYFRGMIAEIALPHKEIYFDQPKRERGKTNNNFYTLFDLAVLGIINHSKVPLRLMTLVGFAGSALSFAIGLSFFVYKLLFWNSFFVGIAPVLIGLFFGFSLMLAFMGVIGEYIGAIHTQLQNRPWVIEKERMNFEIEPGMPRHGDAGE